MMRLADLPKGRSRRQERREKEAEDKRHTPNGSNVVAPKSFKPAKLEPGQWRPPLVTTQANALHEREVNWLPEQEVLLKTCIRPQQQVDIMSSDEKLIDGAEARHSIIHDIHDKAGVIYLAQTSPPFLKSSLGRKLELSFLSRYFDIPGGRWLRVGYQAELLELIKDYAVREDWSEDVLVVPRPKKLEASSLRLTYRMAPPEDLDLRLAIWPDGIPLGIMDLSAGGAQFYHESQYYWPEGRQLALILVSGEFKVILNARVVRTGKVRDINDRLKGVTSVSYADNDPAVSHKYVNFLVEIYRHALALRSGVE